MALRGRRGLAVVEAEVAVLTMAMRRGHLWSRSSESLLHPTLLQPFIALKRRLATESDLLERPNVFLTPFLDVIRSEAVTGPITGQALSAVNKFLSYDLLLDDQTAAENIADAVTHARFVGVDPASDEIVLMKIMEVLRTLVLSPVGLHLTNESVCEIMQSTFRICFETRLSELLRKKAEHVLADMIQVLFTRLPTFSEENLPLLKKLKMRSGGHHDRAGVEAGQRSKRQRAKRQQTKSQTSTTSVSSTKSATAGETASSEKASDAATSDPVTIASSPTAESTLSQFNVDSDVLARSPLGSVSDLTQIEAEEAARNENDEKPTQEKEDEDEDKGVEITVTSPNGTDRPAKEEKDKKSEEEDEPEVAKAEHSKAEDKKSEETFVNSQGVTFTPTTDMVDDSGSLVPYGLPCVRELFRFLVSLVNPHDSHNQESMIQTALSLLATALETGADHLDKFESLLVLVKDDLARNLVSLLSAERIATFSSALWISFLVFDSQRKHLKYQLEIFLNKLNEVVCSESQKVTYEHKELALEMVVRLYRIPGFLTQLYLNFDCDMYTSNIFEDLTKMLSKNAFPVTGLYSTHFLSLDALLTVIEAIESHCQRRIVGDTASQEKTEKPALRSPQVPLPGKSSGQQFGSSANAKAEEAAASNEKSKEQTAKQSVHIPSHEEVMALKHKKKLITSATEQFNAKPAKGIAYMQECGLLKSGNLDPVEVAAFMRHNPHLDKKQLGEYLSNRKNLEVLEAFVQSFDFVGLRVDESLRLFLETFRLPGEAPLIQLILEHFADHWQRTSGDEHIHTADSAFTLSYAVIMLNVDQHNKNVSKTSDPMTEEDFKRNLRGTNDNGTNHDQDTLHDIYHAIRNEEIVMPAEQTGIVKENYLWKCVLKRGQEVGSELLMAPNGYFDHDLFSIIWGPTVAALSYVFDKSDDDEVVQRALHGFQRCAMIAAHYHMSDVFDNLVISLCKFTTLLSSGAAEEPPAQFIPSFGMNQKALLATKTVFSLVQKHGDILRDGWKNITECLLQLFKCQLLPKSMMEAEDYIESAGRVKLYREESQTAKVETGFLNSFMSFVSMSSEAGQRIRTPEEEEFAKIAAKCIKECALDSLITESKFLLADSLQELIKFLISGSSMLSGEGVDEHATLFFLELMVRVAVQNRDRVQIIWRQTADHASQLIMSNTEKGFLLERSVTALMRLAVRLSRKEELASTVVQALQVLLALKVNLLFHVCRHISFGLYELLRNNAANIHESNDWAVLFALIEVVGAGTNPGHQSGNKAGEHGEDVDSGHVPSSDSESRGTSPSRPRSESISSSGGWIVLGSSSSHTADSPPGSAQGDVSEDGRICYSRNAIVHNRPIVMHESISFLKCCESMAFLIRDVAHITPHNYPHSVQTLRTFVEASFVARHDPKAVAPSQGGKKSGVDTGASSAGDGASLRPTNSPTGRATRSHMKRTPPGRAPPTRKAMSAPNNNAEYDADESDSEDLSSEYHHASLQLLDLMHTLHTRAGHIHKSWAAEGDNTDKVDLWSIAWCPLLQGMARLCCDKRSHIRTSALTTLQRALLFQDLHALTSTEWESCFTRVLFPMLDHLLVKSNPGEKTAMEETRTRAATLLGKVFLQHLTPLTSLPTFTALWLTVLDFMQKFIEAATSDLLADAVPESLKNMLLVMDTAGIFFDEGGKTTSLWKLTSDKLETFLPNLMNDLFSARTMQQNQPPAVQEPQTGVQETPRQEQIQVPPQAEAVQAPPEVEQGQPSQPAPEVPPQVQEPPQTISEERTDEIPPPSPMDPPVMAPSAIVEAAMKHSEKPICSEPTTTSSIPLPPLSVVGSQPLPSAALRSSTAVVLPSMPQIAPLPPPPIAIPPLNNANFQPIHVAPPNAGVAVAAVARPNPQLASYFGGSGDEASSPTSTTAPGNILTAAFTPTLSAGSPVIVAKTETKNEEKKNDS